MEDDYKKRIRHAVEQHQEKIIKQYRGEKRKNQKPEKEVEKQCLEWMREQGWSVEIYESKATKDINGVWRNQAMKAGTTDCMGSTNEGINIIVEFKAKGRLSASTLRPGQREFLLAKIESNCFACVVDSKERLQQIYLRWKFLRDTGNSHACQEYLKAMLPKGKTKEQDGPLFP